jgi:hypothetical protein
MTRAERLRRLRISKAMKRKWREPGRRQRLARWMTRQWQDPAYRRARVRTMKGHWRNDATKRRMSRAFKRRWRDPAHRRKMIRALTKAWRDPATRKRRIPISTRNLGPSQGARRLHRILADGWFLEFYTPHGFIDIANPIEHIAIEVDGIDHRKPVQRRRDERKQRGLIRDGWTVHRVDEYRCRALPKRRRA